MSSFSKRCRFLLTVCLGMLCVGLALPILLAFTVPDVRVSPSVWDFLQLGGLGGAIVFWFLSKFGKDQPTGATS
jgi:hypothetical protein